MREDAGFVLPPVPHARFSNWDYEQILKENFSGVVKALGVPALDLLCDLLGRALEFSVAESTDPSRGDGSYLWRPAIGDDPRNLDRSLRNSLVTAVRDAAMGVARENPGILPDLFDRLAGRQCPDLARWDAVPHRWDSDPEDRIDAEEFARAWSASRAALLTSPDGVSLDAAFAFPPADPPVDLTTPKQAEWLRTAEPADIVRFARVWREAAMIGAPGAAGLCKKLGEVTTTAPGRVAPEGPAFADLPDDYLRAVFTGLREATKQGVVTFDWAPVLDLVRLVAGRSAGDTEADRWLRISVARLL